MITEIKSFSDIEYCVREMVYWLGKQDYDKAYSNRGYLMEKARSLLNPCYINLWMILYPLEGQEVTIDNNIRYLANWLNDIIKACKDEISLGTVYNELTGDYLRHVISELHMKYGYPDLTGKLGKDISMTMWDIFIRIGYDLSEGNKKDKRYQISIQTIQDIIKTSCNLKD